MFSTVWNYPAKAFWCKSYQILYGIFFHATVSWTCILCCGWCFLLLPVGLRLYLTIMQDKVTSYLLGIFSIMFKLEDTKAFWNIKMIFLYLLWDMVIYVYTCFNHIADVMKGYISLTFHVSTLIVVFQLLSPPPPPSCTVYFPLFIITVLQFWYSQHGIQNAAPFSNKPELPVRVSDLIRCGCLSTWTNATCPPREFPSKWMFW